LSVDSTAALEKSILNYAILNGALELLPQSMASMAIIPLQMKMVHGIGKAHGYELDRGAIKDLLATLGVGLTGQYLEEIGRKVIGGLFGKAAGRLLGGLAGGATGVAFSFATTYALGHVALRYYAGGRTMSTQLLKESYASVLTRARGLQSEYRPQIEAQARNVDLAKLVQMARGR
ncbi:MAG TPA: GTPase, partial [Gammaproteobacteria bacterium]|nr:GTPase [Gammaproteobacteria bacterium]